VTITVFSSDRHFTLLLLLVHSSVSADWLCQDEAHSQPLAFRGDGAQPELMPIVPIVMRSGCATTSM